MNPCIRVLVPWPQRQCRMTSSGVNIYTANGATFTPRTLTTSVFPGTYRQDTCSLNVAKSHARLCTNISVWITQMPCSVIYSSISQRAWVCLELELPKKALFNPCWILTWILCIVFFDVSAYIPLQ